MNIPLFYCCNRDNQFCRQFWELQHYVSSKGIIITLFLIQVIIYSQYLYNVLLFKKMLHLANSNEN